MGHVGRYFQSLKNVYSGSLKDPVYFFCHEKHQTAAGTSAVEPLLLSISSSASVVRRMTDALI